MRGIPLRCPYLYTIKRNKSVSDFSCLQTYYTRRKDMQEIKITEEYQKEVDITEEEIETYSGCSERTQRCLTDCPWPFPGSYINAAK